MYTFDSRIRYSETDETGALSLLGVINYLQDCSTFQSEDIGLGVEYLEEKKRAWLLSSWRIVIDRYPVLGERIKIGTWATSSKGIYGYRDFVIMDQDGNYLVRAESIWFFCVQRNKDLCGCAVPNRFFRLLYTDHLVRRVKF